MPAKYGFLYFSLLFGKICYTKNNNVRKEEMVMEQNTQTLELLARIEKNGRRQLIFTQILCTLALVAAVFCVVALIQIRQLMPQLHSVIAQMQTVLSSMEEVSAELSQMDLNSIVGNIEGLVGNVEGLVGDVSNLTTAAQDSLTEAMSKLNAINFETLNRAIEDLADVVEPLAKFFNVFN